MSGIPYWTFDIGAYSLGCQGGVFMNGGKDPAYQEFYTRMFQLGAFSPIFRAHGSETPREIWEFGEYTPVLEKFDNLALPSAALHLFAGLAGYAQRLHDHARPADGFRRRP